MHYISDHLTTGVRCNNGGLHLGHYIGNIAPILNYQQEKTVFFILGDTHPTINLLEGSVNRYIESVIMDSMACGLDFQNVYFVKQSELRERASMLYEILSEFTTQRQLEKIHPKRSILRNGKSIVLSDYLFPFQQAVDVLALHSEYVVSNVDNLALVNYSRHIAQKFNNKFKKNVLSTPYLLHGSIEKVLGYDRRKMSKLNNNIVSLSFTQSELKDYVLKIFNFRDAVRGTTDGKLRRNLAFMLLEGLGEKKEEVLRIKVEYSLGEVTEKRLQDFLFDKLDEFLKAINDRRSHIIGRPQIIYDALEKGSLYLKLMLEQINAEILEQ